MAVYNYKVNKNAMKILAIDTSTDACSAALLTDDGVLDHFELAPSRHAHLILSMIDAVLADAEVTPASLDALAFGRGPGSFTGLRIAAGVIQGIAFGLDLPVVPVSTLAGLAQAALQTKKATHVLAALDARMNEVYWGAYAPDGDEIMQCIGREIVCAPAQVPVPESGSWIGVGPGWARYAEELQKRVGGGLTGWEGDFYPHARYIARLAGHYYSKGLIVDAAQAVPTYLRDEVAWKTP
jgi:tRNA threonylcarbamoyladenosine biosynthesis protein TsaB